MAGQAHDYWEHVFLHTAGLPVTRYNVYFLQQWAKASTSNGCAHNPIDLSQAEPGSQRCRKIGSGKYARSYTSTASAAAAFADQLNLSDYPELRLALASGQPFVFSHEAGVALNLQKWGSIAWQHEYASLVSIPQTADANATAPASKNVGAAWTHLMRTLARDGHRTIVELQRATAALSRIEHRLRRA